MTEKCTVNIWIKGNSVKAVFSDNQKLFQKDCSSPEEAKKEYDIIKSMLTQRGHEIKIKDDEE